MKKVFKVLGILIGIVLLVIVLFAGYIGVSDIPSYPTANISYHMQSSPEAVARGQKLAAMLCANCHLNVETGKLTGKKMLDAPAEFGEIFSQNITQDPEFGIGTWSDAEILYLLRTGIKKNGQYSPPYMAKMPNMADEDVNAIIAFLRSDHEWVAPTNIPDKPCEPSFLTKALSRAVFVPFPMPKEPIPLPDTTQRIELGKYLAHNLDCFSCHSADFKSNNYLDPTLSVGYFGGGNMPLDESGRVKLTPNLTPDPETGIGNWSKEKFVRAVKYGLKDGEEALSYPMMPYTQLTDLEVEAIYEYLQTIPAITHKVERSLYD